MAATFVDKLLALKDPRLAIWANKVKIQIVVDATLPKGTDKIEGNKRLLSPDKVAGKEYNTNEYVGLPTAMLGGPTYNLSPTAEQGANNPHVSWLSDIYKQAKGPLLKSRLMSAAEVRFILAEAALKGWAAGDAKTFSRFMLPELLDATNGMSRASSTVAWPLSGRNSGRRPREPRQGRLIARGCRSASRSPTRTGR